MELAAFIKTFIYLISSSLLYPVLILLAALVLWILFQAGSFFAEWLERTRLKPVAPETLPHEMRSRARNLQLGHRVGQYIENLQKIDASSPFAGLAVENLLHESSQSAWRSLDRLRIVARVAPGLGLIGTLIPMGTGLAALGQGDMSRLTSDLVIAFTTTVVGMTLGLLAFYFLTHKSRWVQEDVKNIELATEVLSGDVGEHRLRD